MPMQASTPTAQLPTSEGAGAAAEGWNVESMGATVRPAVIHQVTPRTRRPPRVTMNDGTPT